MYILYIIVYYIYNIYVYIYIYIYILPPSFVAFSINVFEP